MGWYRDGAQKCFPSIFITCRRDRRSANRFHDYARDAAHAVKIRAHPRIQRRAATHALLLTQSQCGWRAALRRPTSDREPAGSRSCSAPTVAPSGSVAKQPARQLRGRGRKTRCTDLVAGRCDAGTHGDGDPADQRAGRRGLGTWVTARRLSHGQACAERARGRRRAASHRSAGRC
jgi:hypothetical protein